MSDLPIIVEKGDSRTNLLSNSKHLISEMKKGNIVENIGTVEDVESKYIPFTGYTSKHNRFIPGNRKIIMQTWKNDDIPDKWEKSLSSVQEHMPGWDYVMMTDEDNRNFIAYHCPDFLPHYDGFPYPIQRADAIRYVWFAYLDPSKYDLGIYMDLDIELLHPLDNLFVMKGKENYFVSSGNLGNWQTNSFMAGRPGHIIWHNMIETMKADAPGWAFTKHFFVLATTGPIAFSRVIKQTDDVWSKLPGSLLMPCSVCDTSCNVSKAWARPLEGQSWCKWDSKFFNILLCNWQKIAIVLAILVILAFIALIILSVQTVRSYRI